MSLFKKVILADHLGAYVSPIYDMHGAHISALDAWISSLSYTLELYFQDRGRGEYPLHLGDILEEENRFIFRPGPGSN